MSGFAIGSYYIRDLNFQAKRPNLDVMIITYHCWFVYYTTLQILSNSAFTAVSWADFAVSEVFEPVLADLGVFA